jgi:NAD(P)-dependent dehydrogenase (short-subunit alcohol dehydrogenase family)
VYYEFYSTDSKESRIHRAKQRRVTQRNPLNRFGSDHDSKGAAPFLASDASNFVTGHVLVVDGGQSA